MSISVPMGLPYTEALVHWALVRLPNDGQVARGEIGSPMVMRDRWDTQDG
ncbi:MAG: hypothetical protein LBV45_07200 [Xanthomonadaceae bacterium]|nr:hypothetical protein [Xanthomonadaceae bacterium]